MCFCHEVNKKISSNASYQGRKMPSAKRIINVKSSNGILKPLQPNYKIKK
ncbi:hypothetical protein KIS4809_3375 [Bacillus sp. ZZV12-4809]|nr:hypothetical protein KIS4809_3375 [Bacillus sp. ZZV12-4809]